MPHTRTGDTQVIFRTTRAHCHHRRPWVLAEDLTRGVLENGEEWGETGYGMRAWGCEKKNPERNPRKLKNVSLVLATAAGGAGCGCSLCLPD